MMKVTDRPKRIDIETIAELIVDRISAKQIKGEEVDLKKMILLECNFTINRRYFKRASIVNPYGHIEDEVVNLLEKRQIFID